MKIVKFNECNVVYAKDQKEYLPLPAHRTKKGEVTSCWKLSLWERLQILFTGKLFLSVLTFNHPLQPQLMSIFNPVKREIRESTYVEIDESGEREIVDPFCLEKKGDLEK